MHEGLRLACVDEKSKEVTDRSEWQTCWQLHSVSCCCSGLRALAVSMKMVKVFFSR